MIKSKIHSLFIGMRKAFRIQALTYNPPIFYKNMENFSPLSTQLFRIELVLTQDESLKYETAK